MVASQGNRRVQEKRGDGMTFEAALLMVIVFELSAIFYRINK